MTEPQPENSAPSPTGERPAVLTHDEHGRIASRTEYFPGGSEPARVTHYWYDELGRIVQMKQTHCETPPLNPAL